MKRKIGILIFSAVFGGFFVQQNLIAESASAASNSSCVDGVFSSLAKHKVTKGDFIQEKSSPKLKRPLKSSGTFIFSSSGIVWDTQKPFPSKVILTENSMIRTKPDGSRTVTDGGENPVFQSVAQTVASLFSGEKIRLEQMFDISETAAPSDSWEIVLKPKDASVAQAVGGIRLSGKIEKGAEDFYSIDSIKIVQSGGETTTYALLNKKYSQELTDGEKALFK